MKEKKVDLFESLGKLVFDYDQGFVRQELASVIVSDGNTEYSVDELYQKRSINHTQINNYLDFIEGFDWKEKLYKRILRDPFRWNSNTTVNKNEYLEVNVSSIKLKIRIHLWKSYSLVISNSGAYNNDKFITICSKGELKELYEKKYSVIEDVKSLKPVSPSIYDVKFDDDYWIDNVGMVKIIKVHDYPNKTGCLFSILCPDSSIKDLMISDIVKLKYLPFDEPPKYKYSFFNDSKNEINLMPFLTHNNDLFNLFWNKIDDAANYVVAVYKKLTVFDKTEYYLISKFDVDRNTYYFAIDNLVGPDFVFKLYAENRNGDVIAESRGITTENKGKPSFFEEVY